MLVLSRQRDESVVIGGPDTVERLLDPEELRAVNGLMNNSDGVLASAVTKLVNLLGEPIEVTTVDIRGDKVRAGYTAPRPIRVDRKEVVDARRREAAAITAKELTRAAEPAPSESA